MVNLDVDGYPIQMVQKGVLILNIIAIMFIRFLKILLEVIGWLQIVISVTLIAGFIGFLIYLRWSNETGKYIVLSIISIGFIVGTVIATRIWKRYGTIAWLSKIGRVS